MIAPENVQGLFLFNQWANRRVLDACAPLTPEQFVKDMGSSFRSVRDTLAHIYGAEWIWHERVSGRAPTAIPAGGEFPDIATVRAKINYQDDAWVDYTTKLAADDLARAIRYKDTAGKEHSTPLWQILQHLANHGSYHRGQVTTMLRQLGAKPISTDLIAFFRERKASATA